MGSTETPLKRHRSVKFHIDESKIKPSIKITVSSDALAETILANSISSSPSAAGGGSGEEDDGTVNNCQQQQQKPALIQIVGNCCSPSANGNGGNGTPPPNSVLCNCSNGDDNRTRIALDDYTVLEFPNCIDFGIKDFLCCKDEIELDLSSDTDASFLDATPPHRFSDSELENQIEAMSITLDTTLNPFPNKNPFLIRATRSSVPDDDDDEEETTEESFIMDEEEGSSSASNNSGATICGGTMDGDIADLEQDEHDDSQSLPCSDLVTQRELPAQLQKEPVASQSSLIEVDGDADGNSHVTKEPVCIADGDENGRGCISEETQSQRQSNEGGNETRQGSLNRDSAKGEIEDTKLTEDSDKSRPINGKKVGSSLEQTRLNSRKLSGHPKKLFKRQISLPASIFMSYLLEQNNKQNQEPITKKSYSNQSHRPNSDILEKHNKLNRSNSCSKKNAAKMGSGIVLEMRLPLQSNKIGVFRSSKNGKQGNSTEDYEYEDINHSNSVSDHDLSDEHLLDEDGEREEREDSLAERKGKWSWESKSDTAQEPHEDLLEDDEQQAFTSEVEKRSLILRHVRRLIRQDTTGNFAPPDFSI